MVSVCPGCVSRERFSLSRKVNQKKAQVLSTSGFVVLGEPICIWQCGSSLTLVARVSIPYGSCYLFSLRIYSTASLLPDDLAGWCAQLCAAFANSRSQVSKSGFTTALSCANLAFCHCSGPDVVKSRRFACCTVERNQFCWNALGVVTFDLSRRLDLTPSPKLKRKPIHCGR